MKIPKISVAWALAGVAVAFYAGYENGKYERREFWQRCPAADHICS